MGQTTRSTGESSKSWTARALPLFIGFIVGLGVGALVAALLIDDEDDDPAAEVGTTVERILDDPDDFGESTLVTGFVREIISPRAFTVASSFVGRDLLVVTDDPLATPTRRRATRPILEGDRVSVIGDPRNFDLAEFEDEVGATLRREFDSFVGDDLGEREGDPAILATTATFYSRTTPVAEANTAEEVAAQPSGFYGKIVALEGRITDVLESGALIIDDTVIVLTADFAQRAPREGENVRIIGPVRPFDPDQRAAGKGPPDDEIFGTFANRPAVVAQSIEIQD